jgi:CNT family concentrative nucleoside transporter
VYHVQPVLGILFIMGLCVVLSANRRVAMRQWRIVAWGLGLQFVFAVVVLKTNWGRGFFDAIGRVFNALIGYSEQGSSFVFGDLGKMKGGVLAFSVLTTIVFFASLMAVLYHLHVMQVVVRATAWVMARTMRTSGAESLSQAANIFVGMTEAPLIIRPFMPTLTRSELMAVMTGGLANIAGGVMAVYVGILSPRIPSIAGHLLTASVMSAPAAFVIAKLLVPETEAPATAGTIRIPLRSPYANVMDAAAGGAWEGLQLMLNVIAMLIAFIALVAMVNAVLGGATGWLFGAAHHLTLQQILGWAFSPLAWLMGVPASDSLEVGQLLGTKTVLNEFFAYENLLGMVNAGALSPRSVLIASYALCGFANLGSVGIMVGGLAILAPNRRNEIARLGLPSMFAGMLASNMVACVAALLVPSTSLFQK